MLLCVVLLTQHTTTHNTTYTYVCCCIWATQHTTTHIHNTTYTTHIHMSVYILYHKNTTYTRLYHKNTTYCITRTQHTQEHNIHKNATYCIYCITRTQHTTTHTNTIHTQCYNTSRIQYLHTPIQYTHAYFCLYWMCLLAHTWVRDIDIVIIS